MEYNKKRLTKLNDRKILHKVRKHWVVVSLALLSVIGGGAMTHVKASANVTPARFTNGLNRQTDASSANQDVTLTSSRANYSTSSSQQLTSPVQASVSQQATNLHNHIIAHAVASQSTELNNSTSDSTTSSQPVRQKSSVAPVMVQASKTPQVQTEKWGQTQIKFVSDGDHGNAGGDVAVVEPGAISDAFYEQNNSDTTYNSDNSNGVKGCYIVNRYNDDLELPFDQSSNNWSLKFAPGTFLPKGAGVSKNDQAPKNGESSNDVNYSQGAIKTNDYRYLFSSTNRSLWNHFKTMDLTNLNTDNAEDLSNMFTGDQSLQKVVLNDSTNPKLTELHGMFADDPQLREVDFNHFNVGNVTNLDSMFMSDVRLRHLNLGNLDTHNVTNMHAMFMSDLALSDIRGIDQLDTGKVTNMVSMFSRDRSLPQLHLDHWNTANVTSMAEMFSGDTGLRDLDLSSFNTGRVSDMSSMFTQDSQLQTLNLANFDTRNVHAIFPGMPVGGMSFMFSGDDHLNKLTLGSHTDLNGPNQGWNSAFFDQIYDVNGNDATAALKAGRQPAGNYYAANYYNHVLLVQQYFTKESEIADQILSNANVQKDPQARARVQQTISQIDTLESSADPQLNTASVNSQVLNDINSVSDLTGAASDQISSAAQWVASSSASSAASLSNYRASVARSAASVSASISASSSALASLSQSVSLSTSTSASVSASMSTSASHSASASASASLSASTATSLRSSKASASKALAMDQLNSYVSKLTTDDQTIVDRDDQALASLNSLRPLNQELQSADARDVTEIRNDRDAVSSKAASVKANVNGLQTKSSTDLKSLIASVQNDVNATRDDSQYTGSVLDHDVSSLASMSNSVSASTSVSTSISASVSNSASASFSQSASLSTSTSASISESNRIKVAKSASLSTKASVSASVATKVSLSQSAKSFNASVSASLSTSTSVSMSNSASVSLSQSASLSASFSASTSTSNRVKMDASSASLRIAESSSLASMSIKASLSQSAQSSVNASLLSSYRSAASRSALNNYHPVSGSGSGYSSYSSHNVTPSEGSSFSNVSSSATTQTQQNPASSYSASQSSEASKAGSSTSYQTSQSTGINQENSSTSSYASNPATEKSDANYRSATSTSSQYNNSSESQATGMHSINHADDSVSNHQQGDSSNRSGTLPQTNETSDDKAVATMLLMISGEIAALDTLIRKRIK